VRERGEVARRPDRSAAGHYRRDAAVQALEQELDGLRAGAGVALGEGVRAQEHRGADDLRRIRAPHAAGVAPEKAQLKLLRELGWDRLRDEPTEARVDPVGVLAAFRGRALDELARRLQPLPPTLGERRPSALDRDGPDVL
jgi:hypothetical protein